MKRIFSVFLCVLLLVPVFGLAETAPTIEINSRIEIYLDMLSFSRQGLIDQLLFDGYPEDAVVAAVDACGADWQEQAVRFTESMLESFPDTSKDFMQGMLLDSGFTREETEAAVKAVMETQLPETRPPFTEITPTPAPESSPVPPRVEISLAPSGIVDPFPEPDPTPVPVTLSVSIQTADIPYENLLHIRNQLDEEILARGDWTSIEIPAGRWIVGEDIPAGFYSVTAVNGKYTSFDLVAPDAYHSHTYYTVEENGVVGKVELKDGMTLEIPRPLLFAAPKSLGF